MPLTTLAVDRSLLLAATEDDDALSLVLDGFVIPVPKAALDETEQNALRTLLAEWGLKIGTVPKPRRRNPSWLTPAILLLLGVTAGLIQIVRR